MKEEIGEEEVEANKWKRMTTILKFKRYTVKWDGSYNYILTDSKDPKRYQYFVSIESVIYDIYKRSIRDNIRNKKKYDPNLLELIRVIKETKKEFKNIKITYIPKKEK